MKLDALKSLGLTKNEIKIYRALLARGTSTTGPILHELGLSSSRLYASLERMIRKGMVSYFIKNNTRYYRAQGPKVLLRYAEEMKKQTEQEVLKLSQLRKKEESGDYTSIFEGVRGFRQVFQLFLTCTSKDEIYTVGFMLPDYHFKALREFLKERDTERNKKKIPMKIILDKSMKTTIGKDRGKERYTEVRYMPKGYIHPAALSIFKEYVIQWVWGERPIVFVIKNKEISQSFKSYFQLLWKMAKK